MATVSSQDWFKIQGWMATELHLSGGELLAYALVHQFTRPKDGKVYTGGVPYLAKFTGKSINTARRYLQNLERKGLIKAECGTANGVPFCHYYTLPKLEGTTPKKREGTPSKNSADTLPKLEGKHNTKQKGKHNSSKKNNKKKDGTIVPAIVREMREYYGKK